MKKMVVHLVGLALVLTALIEKVKSLNYITYLDDLTPRMNHTTMKAFQRLWRLYKLRMT